MAVETSHPGPSQIPASPVTAPTPHVESPHTEPAVPVTNPDTSKSAGYQDEYFKVQSAGSSAILTGSAGNLQQQSHKPHPVAALKKIFGFGGQPENANEVEAPLNESYNDPGRQLGKLQPHLPNYDIARPDVLRSVASGDVLATLQARTDGHANLHIDPEFANLAARTFNDLDQFAGGRFKGKYQIISGLRDSAEQQALREKYAIHDAQGHVVGFSHPVGGSDMNGRHSEHLDGKAMDVAFIGDKRDAAAFFAAFHQVGAQNGGQFVKGDINHFQLGNTGQTNLQVASGSKPGMHLNPAFSV